MKRELPELHPAALARTVDHWNLRSPGGEDHLDLSAPYQRGSVWTEAQRTGLVKSLLMGLPTGAIITSELPAAKEGPSYRVVDGKQRIETIRAFYNGELAVPAWWFPERDRTVTDEGDLTWADLTDRGRRHFGNRAQPELLFRGELVWLHPKDDGTGWVPRRRTNEELVRAEAELYLLVNAAGTPQTDEDLARAAAQR